MLQKFNVRILTVMSAVEEESVIIPLVYATASQVTVVLHVELFLALFNFMTMFDY